MRSRRTPCQQPPFPAAQGISTNGPAAVTFVVPIRRKPRRIGSLSVAGARLNTASHQSSASRSHGGGTLTEAIFAAVAA